MPEQAVAVVIAVVVAVDRLDAPLGPFLDLVRRHPMAPVAIERGVQPRFLGMPFANGEGQVEVKDARLRQRAPLPPGSKAAQRRAAARPASALGSNTHRPAPRRQRQPRLHRTAPSTPRRPESHAQYSPQVMEETLEGQVRGLCNLCRSWFPAPRLVPSSASVSLSANLGRRA